MKLIHRYQSDPSAPRFGSWLRDLLVRGLLPAAALWLVVLGIGFALKDGPLHTLGVDEEGVSRWFAAHRTATLNPVSYWASKFGDTPAAIAACIVVVIIALIATRQWWFAIIPGVAMQLQSMVFVLATWIVDRPRPQVAHLDTHAPPTSSYPSGHVGASFALWWSVLLMVQRIRQAWLRRLLGVLTFLPPFVVMWSRLYRGMHHLSDVLVGAANGICCVLIAWLFLRRKTPQIRA